MTIYEKLEHYRHREGITNQQMADKLGYSKESSYRMAMTRNSRVDLNKLQQMVHILNLSDEEILDLFK